MLPCYHCRTGSMLSVCPTSVWRREIRLPLFTPATKSWQPFFLNAAKQTMPVFPFCVEERSPAFRSGPVSAHSTFLVDMNTWKGDSGGAVAHRTVRYQDQWPLIIGVTRGMQHITDTVKESRFRSGGRITHWAFRSWETLPSLAA